jgi:CBS domain containing-hemolysin-like protein
LILLGVINTTCRALARRFGEQIALRAATVVRALSTVLGPLLALEASLVLWGWGGKKTDQGDNPWDPAVPAKLAISVDADGEPLDEREVRMIRGVVQLDKTTAREIMVPRVDMVAASLGTSMDQLAEQMVKSGHSRIPVYEGSLDQIQGIAHSRDILDHLSRDHKSPGTVTAGAIRSALFIPESKTLEELLNEFQERRVQMAIVVDEYGGVSGLVTIEDLLEEIVGEIRDEFEVGEPEIEPVGDNEFLMDARVGIDQLNELLRAGLEGDGFDTIGGFVYQRLGKIPSTGDRVEYDGLRIEVVSTVGRRLKKLRVTRFAGDDS